MADSAADPQVIREVERDLHRRLLATDPVAPSELAEGYLEPLIERLGRRFPWLDPHQVASAAADSIMSLAQWPGRYDPDRGGLLTYLSVDAAGDLRNASAAARRAAGREVPIEDVEHLDGVELRPPARNLSREEREDPLMQVMLAEEADPVWFRAAYAELDRRERGVVDLMIDGERRTAVYAATLGVEHLPRAEQERAVKRYKDRLVKRLRRRATRGGSGG